MVVRGPAGNRLEIDGLQIGRRYRGPRMLPAPEPGLQVRRHQPQPSTESVATSRQFGFGERTSRSKVQTSVTRRTDLRSPSTTLPMPVAHGRNEFAHKPDGDMRHLPGQVRFRHIGGQDAHKAELRRFVPGLALGDDRVEALVDLGGQQIAQRFPVAVGVGRDDGLVGDLRALQERGDLEGRIGGRDLAQRLQRLATGGQAAQSLVDARAGRLGRGSSRARFWAA